MPASSVTRRTLLAAAGAWAVSPARPAAALPGPYQLETSVWTGSLLLDPEGRSFVLGDLQRPLTLLKLWAGWCPSCAAELPQLTALASALDHRAEIILVSHPQYWANDQAMARRRALPFRLATFAPANPAPIMEQALLAPGGVYSVPRSLLFRERDRSIVLKRDTTTDWGSSAVVNQVKALLA